MSVAAQCPDCCTCPTPTTQWDSVSASLTKCGVAEFSGYVSTPPKRYLTVTLANIETTVFVDTGGDPCADDQDPFDITYSGSATLDSTTCDEDACAAALIIPVDITGLTFAYPIFEAGFTPELLQGAGAANICPYAGSCADFSSDTFSDSIPATPTSATTATYQSAVGR